jgi:hypothetical protein
MQNKKAQQINPIQGLKTGGYQDFRPVSLEVKEAEAAAAPLGAPESVTDSPPDRPLSNREILDRVAAMERIKAGEVSEQTIKAGDVSQLPIPGIDVSVEKVSSSELEQKQPLPSPPKTSPGLQTPSVPESKTQTSSSPAQVKPSAPTKPS